MKTTKYIIMGLLLVQFTLFGQIESSLGMMSSKDVESYAKPLATTLGTAMNSGLYRSAKIDKSFGLSLTFNAVYVMIPEEQRSFLPTGLDAAKGYNTSVKVSSVYGSNQSTVFAGSDGFIGFPGGFDLTHATFILPQLELSLYHTKLIVRYVPGISIVEKKLNLLSLGLKHSVGQYFNLPVDVALHGMYNNFSVGDIINSNSNAFGLSASKTFGILTPYAGLQFESSQTKFEYKKTIAGKQEAIKTEVNGENTVKFTLGAELRYGILGLNVDYNLGNQNNASAGLSFNF